MAAIVMAAEYWRNSMFSIAKYYGGMNLKIGGENVSYTIVNKDALEYMDDDLIEATNADSLDEFFSKINFWQYVENRDRYNEVWVEVKTAN